MPNAPFLPSVGRLRGSHPNQTGRSVLLTGQSWYQAELFRQAENAPCERANPSLQLHPRWKILSDVPGERASCRMDKWVEVGQPRPRKDQRVSLLPAPRLLRDAEPSHAGERRRHREEALFHPRAHMEVGSHRALLCSGVVSEPGTGCSSGALSDEEIATAKRLSTPSEKQNWRHLSDIIRTVLAFYCPISF